MMLELQWYEGPGTPDGGIWLWAIEHLGHPAFYLRALMPGDFAPGRGPFGRHVLHLDGSRHLAPTRPQCGTCGEAPNPEDLEPIERSTAAGGFLDRFRVGQAKWPRPTDPASCWECSNRRERVTAEVEISAGVTVRTCARCAAHLARRGMS